MWSFESKCRVRHSYHLRSTLSKGHNFESQYQRFNQKMDNELKTHIQKLVNENKLAITEFVKKTNDSKVKRTKNLAV